MELHLSSEQSQRLQKRTAQRLASADAKRKVAEEYKIKVRLTVVRKFTAAETLIFPTFQGNDAYMKGDFEEAVRFYEEAVVAYGPRTVYMNNLAAALLKVRK